MAFIEKIRLLSAFAALFSSTGGAVAAVSPLIAEDRFIDPKFLPQDPERTQSRPNERAGTIFCSQISEADVLQKCGKAKPVQPGVCRMVAGDSRCPFKSRLFQSISAP
jgi:hypothetical protein